MINKYCQICHKYISGDIWIVRIADNEKFMEINAHKFCADEIFNRIKSIKNLDKKSVKQIQKEINKYIHKEC